VGELAFDRVNVDYFGKIDKIFVNRNLVLDFQFESDYEIIPQKRN